MQLDYEDEIIYGKYKRLRDASWQCLIDFDIRELPVKLGLIAKKAGIKIIKNADADLLKEKESGASFCVDGKWYIVYDDKCGIHRIRFTVAHEMGHVFLGHGNPENRGCFDESEERDADKFAIRLLSPACVLWGLGIDSAKEISEICEISNTAAGFRFERFTELLRRNKFLTSPLERRVYKNFEEYIKRNARKQYT